MTAAIIDGKLFAEGLRKRIATQVKTFQALGDVPGLAVVLVGDNPASRVYVKNKARQTEEAGMLSFEYRLGETTPEAELLQLVNSLNNDPKVHGILVQLPLPPQINAATVLAAINPDKDVDGFHVVNVGRLGVGDPRALVPCTPQGCLMLLQDQLGTKGLSGKQAVIVGRSNIVGKPMGQLLLAADCTVTIAHSRTYDLPSVVRGAEILIAAVGRPEMIKGEWVREGAIVIDVGINRVEEPPMTDGKGWRLTGDVDFQGAAQRAKAITPVPGGVGPMTIACLLRNTVLAYCQIKGLQLPEGF